ncbi:MAG: hypothetical protein PHP68_03425 [Oscillospiraceae bacterium]|nr:hypothetical protein [Oscillospiraceae bacterium]
MNYDENNLNSNESADQNNGETGGINSEEYINQSADIPDNQKDGGVGMDYAQEAAMGNQNSIRNDIIGANVINQPYTASELVMVKKRVNVKAIVIATVASLVFILGVAVAFSWFMFRPNIKMFYMKPNGYLQELEVKNASLGIDRFNNTLVAGHTGIDKYKASSVLSVNLTSNKENMFIDEYKQYINNSKIEFNTEMDKKSNLSNSEIKVSFNNDMINCSLESIINADKMAIRVPQANEKYILVNENISSLNDFDGIINKLTGKDLAQISGILEGYYKDTFISSLSEADTAFKTGDEYEGIKLNSLTTKIDKETAKKILQNFASKLEKDDEVVEILYNATQSSFSKNKSFMITEGKIKEAVNEFAKNLKQEAQKLDEFDSVELKIYFDNNEKIIARKISNKEFGFVMHSYTKKGKEQFKLALSDEKASTEMFNLEMDGKFTENGFDGDFSMIIKDDSKNSLFKIDWMSKATQKGSSGEFAIEISNRNSITLTYDTTKPAINNVALPVGNYTIKLKGDALDYKVLMEVKEVKKDSEYKTTILFNDLSDLLGDMFDGISLELEMDTVFKKVDKVEVKDIDTLDTIDYEDIDFNEYIAPLFELFGLESLMQQTSNPLDNMVFDDESSFDTDSSLKPYQ